jgi:tetratricopeptide (TPR) repeat protein
MTRFLLLLCFLPALAHGQSAHKFIRSGNHAYKADNFSRAEEQYRKGLELEPASHKAQFNLGNAIYKQAQSLSPTDSLRNGRFQDAIRSYESASTASKVSAEQANAFYNLGTSYIELGKMAEAMQQTEASIEQYKKAVDALKQALRLVPEDMEFKHNLAYAQRKVKQLQDQQKKDQQDKQNQDNQDDKQDEQENKKDQDKQDEQDKKDQQDQKNQPQKPEEKDQPQQPQKRDLSKEEAKRLLQIIENEDKKAQQKMMRAQEAPVPPKNGKDW